VNLFDIVKFVGGPGSLGLLALLCIIGLIGWRVWPKSRRFARAWFASVALAYIVLALPVTAEAIDHLLQLPTLAMPRDSMHVGTLIVLDGDNRRGRLASALSIWALARSRRIIVSGAPWLVERLVEEGVPAARIEREAISATTREQVAWVAKVIERDHSESVAVIASRLQTPRVDALLRRNRLFPLLIPAPLDVEPAHSSVWQFIPSYAALRLSRDAFYEYLALCYYRWRGWIDESDQVSRRASTVPAVSRQSERG